MVNFFFFLLYFLVVSKSLPKIYKILCYRKKLLEIYFSKIILLNKELLFITNNSLKNINNFVKVYKHIPQIVYKILEMQLDILCNVIKEKSNYKINITLLNHLSLLNLLNKFNIIRLIINDNFLNDNKKEFLLLLFIIK